MIRPKIRFLFCRDHKIAPLLVVVYYSKIRGLCLMKSSIRNASKITIVPLLFVVFRPGHSLKELK